MIERSQIDRMRLTHAITLVVAATSLGGCNLYACRYKTRLAATAGAATSPAGTITVQMMNFRDYSDNEPIPRILTWRIESSAPIASLTSISLRDERDTTQVVANIPVTGTNGTLAASALELTTGAERDRMFSLLTGGNAVVHVYAGPAGTPPIRIHLDVTAKENWHRPNCD